MSVSVVVQRFRECRLLLHEERYVTAGGGDDACGVLAYVSFASSATKPQAEKAAQTLLNLPVLTTGLWGDGGSPTRSVLALAAEGGASSCSLVIVPQANLISKVKQGGRSIQYHGQINKEQGQELYDHFCDSLRGGLLEAQCAINDRALPEWYKARRAFSERQSGGGSKQPPSPSTHPVQLFLDESKYSEWDERGIPLKDAEGKELSKSQVKKLNRAYESHSKRYAKWKEQVMQYTAEDFAANANGEVGQGSSPPPAQWDDSLDPSFCHFVAGSFGRRQGLEFRSDMGPFVHMFQV